MARLKMEIKARVYGLHLASAVYSLFDWLGFDEEDSAAAGRACIVIRCMVGRKSSWKWLGRW